MALTAAELAGVAVDSGVADRLAVADGADGVAVGEVVVSAGAGLDSVAADGVVSFRMMAVSESGQNTSTATPPPTSRATAATITAISARERRRFALRACTTGPPNQVCSDEGQLT
jgi:hypothetical protein